MPDTHVERAPGAGPERWGIALASTAVAMAVVAPVIGRASPWALVMAVTACITVLPWLTRRLPAPPRGTIKRRPWLSAVWVLTGLLAVAQIGRLSAFMVDSSRTWGSTVPDSTVTDHQCLSAYVLAADLARRGEPNVYDARWYPALNGDGDAAAARSPVEGLRRWLSDPYEYPPVFLVLPRIALALTRSFDAIRTAWFVIQALAFLLGAWLLARWIGDRDGLLVFLLVPLVLASPPTMMNFQFGQFHAMAIMLSIGAMVAFEERRAAAGGALLAFAALSKIFPGILLVALLARRRWREIGWTLAFGGIFWLVAWVVLGAGPFAAFFSYQLPRLVSGEAFSFANRADVPLLVVSRNLSLEGVAAKLRLMGAGGWVVRSTGALPAIATAAILWLAWRAGHRGATRLARALTWLSLLNLAALRSPVAPSAYVAAPVLWALALLASEVRNRATFAVGLAVAWVLIVGPSPLPGRVDLAFGLAGQAVAIGLALWVLVRRDDSAASSISERSAA